MNIINLLKNNCLRILAKKEIIVVALVIVPLMIGVGILFSGKMDRSANIALVSNSTQIVSKDSRIKIHVMKEKPAISSLLLSKYDAIVEEKKPGIYDVTSIKSKADKKSIKNFFEVGKLLPGDQSEQATRGAGARIIGFILMILFMQGVALITLFPEDRNLKTFRRILTAPVSERLYIFAQGIMTFLFIFLPTYIALVITKLCFDADIGYGLLMLAILIGILSALATSLALFLVAVIKREASVTASGIYMITCILAGCFYSFTGNNKILDLLCSILPQKQYMTMIQGIENGNGILQFKGQLIYLLIWIVALWVLGSSVTKMKMKKGAF